MSFHLKFKEFVTKRQSMSTSMSTSMSASMCVNEEMDSNGDNADIDYAHRYAKLLRRCEAIKSENETLIHSIYKMKKLFQKYRKQKKILMNRLLKHRDDYRSYDFPLFFEKEDSNHSTQQTVIGVKPTKSSITTKSNANSTHILPKPKKSKLNANRSESASNGSVCPKKPINPYLLFCQENRSALQERYHSKHNEEMTHQELTKALAQQWHELSVSDKQVYYNLFNDDKVRYENQMKAFTASSGKESTNESCD